MAVIEPEPLDDVCTPWDLTLTCNVSEVDGAVVDQAKAAATWVLWALTGRRFDICEATQWRAGATGECDWSQAILLEGPIVSVDEVLIDGVEQEIDVDYRRVGHRLYRTSSRQWPMVSSGAVERVQITYTRGELPPPLGLLAAAELACEMVKALREASDCKLPRRIQNIVRQGVSVTLIDPQTFLTEGRIGLYLSDLFITTVNPDAKRSRSTVWSVDLPRHRG